MTTKKLLLVGGIASLAVMVCAYCIWLAILIAMKLFVLPS